tara:strand:- start:10 stop:492 length:483 start_codon:yes stop_codon:yes gene_type:complete
MSGFKTWNNNNSGGNQSGGGGGSSGNTTNNNLQQWSETETGGSRNIGVLSTNKDVASGGVILANSFNTVSDLRFKYNVADLNKNEHLDNLNKLIPKSYKLKNDSKPTFGLIAQEVEKIYPNLVNTDNKGFKSLDYIQLVPLLLLQTNEMERKIEELKNNN